MIHSLRGARSVESISTLSKTPQGHQLVSEGLSISLENFSDKPEKTGDEDKVMKQLMGEQKVVQVPGCPWSYNDRSGRGSLGESEQNHSASEKSPAKYSRPDIVLMPKLWSKWCQRTLHRYDPGRTGIVAIIEVKASDTTQFSRDSVCQLLLYLEALLSEQPFRIWVAGFLVNKTGIQRFSVTRTLKGTIQAENSSFQQLKVTPDKGPDERFTMEQLHPIIEKSLQQFAETVQCQTRDEFNKEVNALHAQEDPSVKALVEDLREEVISASYGLWLPEKEIFLDPEIHGMTKHNTSRCLMDNWDWLGAGASSTVWKVELSEGKYAAAKTVRPDLYEKELGALKTIQHIKEKLEANDALRHVLPTFEDTPSHFPLPNTILTAGVFRNIPSLRKHFQVEEGVAEQPPQEEAKAAAEEEDEGRVCLNDEGLVLKSKPKGQESRSEQQEPPETVSVAAEQEGNGEESEAQPPGLDPAMELFPKENFRVKAGFVTALENLASALDRVHKEGLLHNDLRPSNLLWDPENKSVVLTDWGFALRLNEQGCAVHHFGLRVELECARFIEFRSKKGDGIFVKRLEDELEAFAKLLLQLLHESELSEFRNLDHFTTVKFKLQDWQRKRFRSENFKSCVAMVEAVKAILKDNGDGSFNIGDREETLDLFFADTAEETARAREEKARAEEREKAQAREEEVRAEEREKAQAREEKARAEEREKAQARKEKAHAEERVRNWAIMLLNHGTGVARSLIPIPSKMEPSLESCQNDFARLTEKKDKEKYLGIFMSHLLWDDQGNLKLTEMSPSELERAFEQLGISK